jgi:hypothetical protein
MESSERHNFNEEDWHRSFSDDVEDDEIHRSCDWFELRGYLIVLIRREELEQEGVVGSIEVARVRGEGINEAELFTDAVRPSQPSRILFSVSWEQGQWTRNIPEIEDGDCPVAGTPEYSRSFSES